MIDTGGTALAIPDIGHNLDEDVAVEFTYLSDRKSEFSISFLRLQIMAPIDRVQSAPEE